MFDKKMKKQGFKVNDTIMIIMLIIVKHKKTSYLSSLGHISFIRFSMIMELVNS
jgi:hypothetical protein